MIIGIDIDEVLCEFSQTAFNFFNKLNNMNLSIDQVTDYKKGYQLFGITDQEATRQMHLFTQKGLLQTIPPVKDAKKIIKKLAQAHTLLAITSRPQTWKEQTETFIAEQFPDCFKEVLVIGPGPEKAYDTHVSKANVCKQHNVDMLIDDNPEYCEQCEQIGIRSILFGNYSWNSMQQETDLISRVDTWQDILIFLSQNA